MKTVSYFLAALIIWNSAAFVSGEQENFLEPSESPWALESLAEEETHLPCRFNVSNSEIKVVQVMWVRENSNGVEESIIIAHFSEGQQENAAYSGRVRFATSDPITDSALILMGTRSADEGKYICKIATFPAGNFETEIMVTVWTKPITSLQPFILVEGQTFRPAAICRSVAKPMAGLSWDTELAGQSQNRSLDGEVASIQFSLHPLRNMNGQKLDCLVWHPSHRGPVRISNKLVVHYPPNALISGYEDNWYAEMQGAALQCSGQGNPGPHQFNWTRKDEALPEGVTVEGGTLHFSRPLSLTDKGVYVCTTTNLVGSGKAEILINISELPPNTASVNYMLIIIIAGVAAVIVLTLIIVIISVNRYYKRKNQQLAIELDAKKEEISTLSRQASFRKVNSGSTENRYSDDNNTLKVEGTIRTSLSSLDRPRSRDSRSTLGGLDSLGRPAIYNTSRRGRDKVMDRPEKEARLMESYEQDSNVSQETHLLPPLHPSSYSMEQAVEIIRSRNGSAILPAEGRPRSGGSSRGGSRGHNSPLVSTYPTLTDEEEDSVSPADSGVHRGLMEPDGFENGGSETASSQISEALSSHFERTNGTLWPKSKPNNILLPANTLFLTPHSPTIHKAQIV